VAPTPRTAARSGVSPDLGIDAVTRALAGAGCVAADEEAAELLAAAGSTDELAAMLARRLTGEPLAWITRSARFCGIDVAIEPGVYVPRWQSEPLARLGARLLRDTGTAVDLCTGSGAIAMVLQTAHRRARVVGTERDPIAVACARANGVDVFEGDLFDPLPVELESSVDVVTGVLPYVPSGAIRLLPRDVQQFEPRGALDGGPDGLDLLSVAIERSPRWLRPGGWLLLEAGGVQVESLRPVLAQARFDEVAVLEDGDGDTRGLSARLSVSSRRAARGSVPW